MPQPEQEPLQMKVRCTGVRSIPDSDGDIEATFGDYAVFRFYVVPGSEEKHAPRLGQLYELTMKPAIA